MVPELLGKLAVKLYDSYMISEIRHRLSERAEAGSDLNEVLTLLRADFRDNSRYNALIAEEVLSEGLFCKYLSHERLSNFFFA